MISVFLLDLSPMKTRLVDPNPKNAKFHMDFRSCTSPGSIGDLQNTQFMDYSVDTSNKLILTIARLFLLDHIDDVFDKNLTGHFSQTDARNIVVTRETLKVDFGQNVSKGIIGKTK
jgi:hypothetical protein